MCQVKVTFDMLLDIFFEQDGIEGAGAVSVAVSEQ